MQATQRSKSELRASMDIRAEVVRCIMALKAFLPLAAAILFMWWRQQRGKKFPDGPTGVPILGYLPFLGKSPPRTLIELSKKYGRIFSVNLGRKSFVVLTNYEDIYEAFSKRSSSFSARNISPILRDVGAHNGIIHHAYGEPWKSIRKFCAVTLKGVGVGKRSMIDRLNEELRCFIDVVQAEEGKPIDIQHHLSNAIANVVFSIVSGERYDYGNEEFKNTLHLLGERLNGKTTAKRLFFVEMFPILKYFPYFKESHEIFLKEVRTCSDMFLNSIRQHQETFDKNDLRDFIDEYLYRSLYGKQKDHLEERFLEYHLRDIYHAGTETTTTTLRWCLLYLAQHVHVQDDIRNEINSIIGQNGHLSYDFKNEMPLTCSFIHEMQRCRPTVPLVTHCTTEDVEFAGYHIKRDTPIIANIWQCHYDDETFKDSQTFNPKRFVTEEGKFMKHEKVIPYSVGARYCVGMHVAEMEVFVFLVGIIRSFRLMEDPDNLLPSFTEIVAGLVHSPWPYKLRFVRIEKSL